MNIIEKVVKYADLISVLVLTYFFIEMTLLKHAESYKIIFTIIYVLYLITFAVKLLVRMKV